MLGQLLVRNSAPHEDLQHLIVVFMQQPWADACLAIRRDKVHSPVATRYVHKNTMHGVAETSNGQGYPYGSGFSIEKFTLRAFLSNRTQPPPWVYTALQ